jgi:hypothetical protein
MTSTDYRREQFSSDKKVHEQSGSSDEDRSVFGSAPGTWARAGRRSGIVKRRTGDARVDIEIQSGKSDRMFSPATPAMRQESTVCFPMLSMIVVPYFLRPLSPGEGEKGRNSR